jgi:hypothetical protein
MVQAYSLSDGKTVLRDAGVDLWIRLRGHSLKVSKKFQMRLITAGSATDPVQYVEAVNEFWIYCRDTRKGTRQGWIFQARCHAETAYRMLQRIIEM